MNLSYKKVGFILSLSKEVKFSVPVPFLFRSVIGFQLRKMCCIARNNLCADCMFNATCIYGLTFESIVPKNNAVLTGRNRISHPVIIDIDGIAEKEITSIELNLIFLGRAIPYIPYFYYAILKGGETGIAKERIRYRVNDIIEYSGAKKERSLLIDEQHINTQLEPELWEFNPRAETLFNKCYIITLVTPLRFKSQGHNANEIIGAEFAQCLHRRAQVLCSQYGYNDFSGEYLFPGNWTVSEQNLKWRDYVHYSARQKKEMRLGGLIGSFTVSGDFSSYEHALLKFAELFHGGKNTNFGLGKITMQEKEI